MGPLYCHVVSLYSFYDTLSYLSSRQEVHFIETFYDFMGLVSIHLHNESPLLDPITSLLNSFKILRVRFTCRLSSETTFCFSGLCKGFSSTKLSLAPGFYCISTAKDRRLPICYVSTFQRSQPGSVFGWHL